MSRSRYVVLLLFSFVIHTGSVDAQITIQSSAIGSLFGTSVDQTSFAAEAGQSGAIEAIVNQTGPDQTWDFTGLEWTSDGTFSINYVELPAELPASDDPRVADANYAIQFFEPADQEEFQLVLYRQLEATGNYSFGSYAVFQEGTSDLLYDEPLFENPFPLSYGMDPWEGMTSYSNEFEAEGQVFTRTVEIELDGSITGWGTLRLPGQDPIDVLRLEETRTETSTITGVPGSTVNQFTNVSFISSSLTNASISLSPDGSGTSVNSASYTIFGSGGGATEPPAAAPVNLNPADGATGVSTDPTLSWDDVSGSDSYDLQVATDASFSKRSSVDVVVDETGLTATSFDVVGLQEATEYFWRTRGVNANGAGPWSATQSFTTVSVTSIETRDSDLPSEFGLVGNYPNPFNPRTTITFDVAEQEAVRVSVFDMLGRELDVLVARELSAGRYDVVWNAGTRPSGTYLVRMEAGAFSTVQTIMLLK